MRLSGGSDIAPRKYVRECANKDDLAHSFSEFLDDVAPQYKENVVSAADFIDLKNKN